MSAYERGAALPPERKIKTKGATLHLHPHIHLSLSNPALQETWPADGMPMAERKREGLHVIDWGPRERRCKVGARSSLVAIRLSQ
jgi:hypothetical protein